MFGKIKIGDKNSFTIQFSNFSLYAGIGIVDQTYKQQFSLKGLENRIIYFNDSRFLDGI